MNEELVGQAVMVTQVDGHGLVGILTGYDEDVLRMMVLAETRERGFEELPDSDIAAIADAMMGEPAWKLRMQLIRGGEFMAAFSGGDDLLASAVELVARRHMMEVSKDVVIRGSGHPVRTYVSVDTVMNVRMWNDVQDGAVLEGLDFDAEIGDNE